MGGKKIESIAFHVIMKSFEFGTSCFQYIDNVTQGNRMDSNAGKI